jgi:hypothetical protein
MQRDTHRHQLRGQDGAAENRVADQDTRQDCMRAPGSQSHPKRRPFTSLAPRVQQHHAGMHGQDNIRAQCPRHVLPRAGLLVGLQREMVVAKRYRNGGISPRPGPRLLRAPQG